MKRWPIIRHARYYWHLYHMRRWWALWSHFGYFPNAADIRFLDDIWTGKR